MRAFLALCMIMIGFAAFSQNSAEKLRQSREKALQDIEYANKLLKETEGQAKQSLNEINIINHKLSKRKEYLLGLEAEVNVIAETMSRNQEKIVASEQEIARIKSVYARMIVNVYKRKIPRYRTMYFFASENLNQLYKRIHTVKLYNSYLKKERSRLEELKASLVKVNFEMEQLRSGKDVVMNKTKSETRIIQKEVEEKNRLVKQLKKRQREIEEEIRNKERTAKKIENELKKVIEEERKKTRGSGGKSTVTPEDKIVSTDFEKNFGRLPWPTQKGIISGKYGEHQHPDYKNVTVRNDGVYISTSEGENARSIFKGIVSRVFIIPGENYTVIIRHGKYFTMYHNLVNVRVKPGQEVNAKEVIGTVFTDNNTKETVLYFQIWKETERSDPELWMAPI